MRRVRGHAARRGISMVESLTSVTITAIAGAALLTSIGGAVRSSTDTAHAAVARGLAAQLMTEIASVRFPTEANTSSLGNTRDSFDDIDDYDDWTSSPPVDRQGRPLGTEGAVVFGQANLPRLHQMRPSRGFLEHFARSVQVERVVPDADSGWNVVSRPTDFRRVTVRVTYTDDRTPTRTLAEMTRIFSHVPVTP